MKRLLFVLILTGCATTKGPTFSQLLATAETADDAIVLAATSALQSGLITSVQAKKVLAITDSVSATLAAANTAYNAGNPNATSEIIAATALLTTVQGCLNASSKAIDSCLAPMQPRTP